MHNFHTFFRTDMAEGLAAVGLSMIVASALVILSLTLCTAVSLVAGLPATDTAKRRT